MRTRMHEPIQLKAADEASLGPIAWLEHNGAFDAQPRATIERWWKLAESPRVARGRLLWATLRIATLGSQVVAYAAAIGEGQVAQVRVVVAPSHRRRRFGTIVLIDALEKARRSYGMLSAEAYVSERCATSLAFIRSFWFAPRMPYPVARDWFGERHDAYVLQMKVGVPHGSR